MKEPVTILIPVLTLPLTAVAMNSLASVNEHLSNFPITFIKGESVSDTGELTEFCPSADFVSFDDRYFSSGSGYAKLLMGNELYHSFGWSRYLLICEMNTVILRNELAYWCRQGYDFIQPSPALEPENQFLAGIERRYKTKDYIDNHKIALENFNLSCGISLRNIEAFQKLIKRKQRMIHHYLSTNPEIANDALFWEFYTNRWWPDINTPTDLSRNRFAQSATFAAEREMGLDSPFAISGLVKPLAAPHDL